VLPADEGRGPREVADPNFVPLSFKPCNSAGHLVWKSAALTDLESFRSALIKQGARGPATQTGRAEVR